MKTSLKKNQSLSFFAWGGVLEKKNLPLFILTWQDINYERGLQKNRLELA